MDNTFIAGIFLGFILAILFVIFCIYINDYLSKVKNNNGNVKFIDRIIITVFLLSAALVVYYIRYKWGLIGEVKIKSFIESKETFLIWNTCLLMVLIVLLTYKGTKSIYSKMKTNISLWDLYILILFLAVLYIVILGTSSYSNLFTFLFGSILAVIIFIFSESKKIMKKE